MGVGDTHTVVIRSDGSAHAFGANDEGQCDIPETFGDITYIQASSGQGFTALLRSDGEVIVCGDGLKTTGMDDVIPPLPSGLFYARIAAGCSHLVFLRSDGKLFAIGDNFHGQLDVPQPPDNEFFTEITSGSNHTVALTSDGNAIAWGQNEDGQCAIPALPGGGIWYVNAATGMFHTLLLKSDGNAVAIGEPDDEAKGAVDVPQLPQGVHFTQVACGAEHSLFLRSDGQMMAAGLNDWGQCNVPEDLGALVSVAGGGWHTVALQDDGRLVGFGADDVNQLDFDEEKDGYVVDRVPSKLLQASFVSKTLVRFRKMNGDYLCDVSGETFEDIWTEIQKMGRSDAVFQKDGQLLSELASSQTPVRSWPLRLRIEPLKVQNRVVRKSA